MTKIVSTKEFAELAGIAPGTVSNALNRPGGKLSAAKMGRGRIDLDHPAADTYLEHVRRLQASYKAGRKKRGRGSPNHTGEPAPPPVVTSEKAAKIISSLPPDIRRLVDRPLRELVEQFGTSIEFVDFLKAVREIERIHTQRLKNAQAEGLVVGRDIVRRGVIEPFDLCCKRLLSDGARTIGARVAAMARAGEEDEACEQFVREKLADFIKGVKAAAEKVLEGV
jgi:hypothetical protein